MSARVLIIEDNPANLELMTYLLTAYGYSVHSAENGIEGVETARREHPELIICDVQLPDIDGFEVARRLHREPALSSIPIVAVTALAMVGDRDRAIGAGFDGYVTKPIDPEKFVPQMEAFLPHRQRRSVPRSPVVSAAASRVAPPRRFTILSVDSLPVNLDLARSILEPSGYKVITAGSIAEGLAHARKSICHLILSDLCMSEGTGYDFLREVRADPQLETVPFFLVTSTMITDKDRDRGLALGADRFLRLPIEPEALLAEIQACLNEKGMY